jgi:hypothetical protein
MAIASGLVVVVALLHFAAGVKTRLGTGMTGFDSTWYHGPFAAGFFQSGDTWGLHLIAPQFLAWFYPANAEIFHAVGMLAFDRDVLSPLLNLGWFAGCLLACWCIGRPFGVAPWSLALGAVALSVPAFADQAGEARNDIVGTFFLLAAAAIMLNAWTARRGQAQSGGDEAERSGGGEDETECSGGAAPRARALVGAAAAGPFLLVGLAAGLAAGTKLNFLLPAAVLVLGVALLAPRGGRWRSAGVAALAAIAGGGYWYLRNLVHAGNPLPWIHHLGPIDLPAPAQGVGGREAHSVFDYLTDGGIWSEWFLPGFREGLWIVWPLLLAAALAGLLLAVASRGAKRTAAVAKEPRDAAAASPGSKKTRRDRKEPRDAVLASRGSKVTSEATKEPRDSIPPSHGSKVRSGTTKEPGDGNAALVLAGLTGLAAGLAWLLAPASASGPDRMPRGFESGLRYLAPALVLGLALLPTAPLLRARLARFAAQLPSGWLRLVPSGGTNLNHSRRRRAGWALGGVAVVLAVAVGYPVQRHYLESRYSDPTFTAPGLNAAFAWASDVSGARIATTSTRQYPLFGTDLSNHVRFLGLPRPHGGFTAPTTCPQFRRLLNAGDYDYAVATYDRETPGAPPYPPQARWTEAPGTQIVLRKPPTVVFKLNGPLDPSTC